MIKIVRNFQSMLVLNWKHSLDRNVLKYVIPREMSGLLSLLFSVLSVHLVYSWCGEISIKVSLFVFFPVPSLKCEDEVLLPAWLNLRGDRTEGVMISANNVTSALFSIICRGRRVSQQHYHCQCLGLCFFLRPLFPLFFPTNFCIRIWRPVNE